MMWGKLRLLCDVFMLDLLELIILVFILFPTFYEFLCKILALDAVSCFGCTNLKLKFIDFLYFYEEKQVDGRSESDAMSNVYLTPKGSFRDFISYCCFRLKTVVIWKIKL